MGVKAMNPTVLLIPLCGLTVLGAGMLAGRLGEGTAVRAGGAVLFLFGGFAILTILFARRMKAFVDGLAAQARDRDAGRDAQSTQSDREGDGPR